MDDLEQLPDCGRQVRDTRRQAGTVPNRLPTVADSRETATRVAASGRESRLVADPADVENDRRRHQIALVILTKVLTVH